MWWLAGAVGLVLVVAALCVALAVWRRLRTLRVGGIEVALRTRADDSPRGWHLGVGHYRGEEFAWYRVLSVSSGPNLVLSRGKVEIAERREPTLPEGYTMPAGATILRFNGFDGQLELAMGPDALTGFLSWLESAPPGSSIPWAS